MERAESIRKNEPEKMDEERPSAEGGAGTEQQTNAEDEQPDDRKKKKNYENSILQSGLNRVSVRVKRHVTSCAAEHLITFNDRTRYQMSNGGICHCSRRTRRATFPKMS